MRSEEQHCACHDPPGSRLTVAAEHTTLSSQGIAPHVARQQRQAGKWRSRAAATSDRHCSGVQPFAWPQPRGARSPLGGVHWMGPSRRGSRPPLSVGGPWRGQGQHACLCVQRERERVLTQSTSRGLRHDQEDVAGHRPGNKCEGLCKARSAGHCAAQCTRPHRHPAGSRAAAWCALFADAGCGWVRPCGQAKKECDPAGTAASRT